MRANAAFDFSELTTSVVAVVTDQKRDGKPVVGYAWGSIGRHACGGQMRDRFIPRILAAKPETLIDASGENLDPGKILACMMQREKAGGHSERSNCRRRERAIGDVGATGVIGGGLGFDVGGCRRRRLGSIRFGSGRGFAIEGVVEQALREARRGSAEDGGGCDGYHVDGFTR